MYINRRTFPMKQGAMEPAIELFKDLVKDGKAANLPVAPREVKLLTAYFGPFDLLVMEVEFEDLASYESYWGEVFGHPLMVAFFEKWNTLNNGGGANELWEVR
jgi:hypothetical protein